MTYISFELTPYGFVIREGKGKPGEVSDWSSQNPKTISVACYYKKGALNTGLTGTVTTTKAVLKKFT